MENDSDDSHIDEYLEAIVPAMSAMDFRTFNTSISWDRYDPLIAELWTKRLLRFIDALEKSGLTPKEQALLMPCPGEIREHIFFDLWGAKYAGVSKKDRLKIFSFWSNMLRAVCTEDPYAQNKNCVHNSEEIVQMTHRLSPATKEIARTLGRAASAGYHIGHAVYSDMHPSIVYENYGPYDVSHIYGEGHILAVKEFNNLRCPDLWKQTQDFPHERFVITAVYKDVTMRVDGITHVITTGNLVEGLRHFSVTIDDKPATVEEIAKIAEMLESISADIFEEFQTYDTEQKKRVYVHQKLYARKKLYDILGKDWRPSKEKLTMIKDKPLYQPEYPEEKHLLEEVIRKTLDPRTDFKI